MIEARPVLLPEQPPTYVFRASVQQLHDWGLAAQSEIGKNTLRPMPFDHRFPGSSVSRGKVQYAPVSAPEVSGSLFAVPPVVLGAVGFALDRKNRLRGAMIGSLIGLGSETVTSCVPQMPIAAETAPVAITAEATQEFQKEFGALNASQRETALRQWMTADKYPAPWYGSINPKAYDVISGAGELGSVYEATLNKPAANDPKKIALQEIFLIRAGANGSEALHIKYQILFDDPNLNAKGLLIDSRGNVYGSVDMPKEGPFYVIHPAEHPEASLNVSPTEGNNTPRPFKGGVAMPAEGALVTQTPEPTKTPIPESPQQIMEREVAEAVAAGATANNPDTWIGTALEEYRTTFENASNPDIATDAKLDELDAMLTVVRWADMEQFLATQPDAATAVLATFARSGLIKGGSTEADVIAMTPEQLQEFTARLSSHDRLLLEIVRRAMAKENIVLSPVEIIAMETDINGLVPFDDNVVRGKVVRNGYYGMWVEHSDQLPDDMSTFYSYAIPMFGRTTVHGKDIIRRDILTSDTIMGDVVGIASLPEGKTGVVILMKAADGTPYLHTYEVALNPDNPVVIPLGSTVLGLHGPANTSSVYASTRDVALTTMYAVDKDAYKEFKKQLTPEILTDWLAWPPFLVKIHTGGAVSMMPAGMPSQFFDPDNGLMVIGSEVDGLSRMGYLFFGTDGHNPWP